MYIVRIHENIDIVVDKCHHIYSISWACPCDSEDPWGLLAAPSNLRYHKTQSGLATQRIFLLIL